MMATEFENSSRIERITKLLTVLFPEVEFSALSTGLRIVGSKSTLPKNLMKVKTKDRTYMMQSKLSFNTSDLGSEAFVRLEIPEEKAPESITPSLVSEIVEKKNMEVSHFADLTTRLFKDLRYGFLMGEQNNFKYMLPYSNAQYVTKEQEEVLEIERDQYENIYLGDEKLSAEDFEEYVVEEVGWLLSKLEEAVPKEWCFDFQIRQDEHNSVREYFLTIRKHLDIKFVERLDGLIVEEDYQKLLLMTKKKPFLIGRMGFTFSNEMVIMSVPVRTPVSEQVMDVDPTILASTYMIAREGSYPKLYTLLSFQECIVDVFSWVAQIVIQDADLDGASDILDFI